jgi:hypothetical protein
MLPDGTQDAVPDYPPLAFMLPAHAGVPERGQPGSTAHTNWTVDRLARRYLRYMLEAWLEEKLGPEDWLDTAESRLGELGHRLEHLLLARHGVRVSALALVAERVQQILNPGRHPFNF